MENNHSKTDLLNSLLPIGKIERQDLTDQLEELIVSCADGLTSALDVILFAQKVKQVADALLSSKLLMQVAIEEASNYHKEERTLYGEAFAVKEVGTRYSYTSELNDYLESELLAHKKRFDEATEGIVNDLKDHQKFLQRAKGEGTVTYKECDFTFMPPAKSSTTKVLFQLPKIKINE